MTEPHPVRDPDSLRESFADPPDVIAQHGDELRREVVAAQRAGDAVDELLHRGDLVQLLRVDGQLDEALREAQAGVDRAEIVGETVHVHLASVRLAAVHCDRGDFAESNLGFTELMPAAAGYGPIIEAYTHHAAGLNDYRQGHFADARDHFAHAARQRAALEHEDVEESRIALAAAKRRLEEAT